MRALFVLVSRYVYNIYRYLPIYMSNEYIGICFDLAIRNAKSTYFLNNYKCSHFEIKFNRNFLITF